MSVRVVSSFRRNGSCTKESAIWRVLGARSQMARGGRSNPKE